MHWLRNSVLTFICALTLALPVSAQVYPDPTELFINDFADLLPEENEIALRETLIELREKRDIEFTVVTINRMADYGHTGEIEPFATGLFNYWGIGNADRNDGVLLLVAREDRRVRLEVGSGYGTDKNGAMLTIIDDRILPRFRRDDYVGGIEGGVDAVIIELTGRYPGQYDATPVQRGFSWIQRLLDGIGQWAWAIVAPFLLIPYRAYRRWQRNKPRICPTDGSKMMRLDEEWDDQQLDQGQRTEERLKSVDYDVWDCQQCLHTTVEAYKSWFSRYSACRTCGY